MFNRIRNSIASFIAVKAADTPATRAADKAQDDNEARRRSAIREYRNRFEALAKNEVVDHRGMAVAVQLDGMLNRDDILSLSEQSVKAIAGYAAWEAHRDAFNAYVRNNGKVGHDCQALIDTWWNWTALVQGTATPKPKAEAVKVQTAKFCVIREVKVSPEVAAILARNAGKSEDEVTNRLEKLAAESGATRESFMNGFNAALLGSCADHGNLEFDANKALETIKKQASWIANNWTGKPEAIASILLDMEEDQKEIRLLCAKHDADTHKDFIDGSLTTDAMMRNAHMPEDEKDFDPRSSIIEQPDLSAELALDPLEQLIQREEGGEEVFRPVRTRVRKAA